MNAIDVVRNELACLGLHPGARHPNVADSTPVQNEDSTAFYDYWTFGNPTVIKTSETGRLLEATVYASATDGDEQSISIDGEAACQEYIRQAVAWESEDADRIRHDACVRSVLARITELAEDNPALTTWALAHAPVVDIDTENLTLTLTVLDGNPMIDLHTSRIAGGGWARLPGHSFDDLDSIIKSPTLRHLAHMVGAQRKQLASFLRPLSTELDDILSKAQHAPGIPTLTQAIEAANRAATVEAGPQENAHIVGESTEAAARATQRSSIPPEMLGKSAPHIGTQAFTMTPMRWVPTPTIHQAEGRSL